MALVLALKLVRLSIIGLLLVVFSALAGCGTDTQSAPAPAKTDTDSSTDENKAADSQLPAATQKTAAFPKTEVKSYESGTTGVSRISSPSEVCDAFVRSLHSRNILAAERLLTLTSRLTIEKSGLELDAIAGENAQYVIGDAKYATQLKQLAYVDCHVSERSPDGEVNFVVSWMLKPEAGYGWRVFGMVMNENGQKQMINFENSDHAEVVSDIYSASEQVGGPEQRQANQNSESVR